MEKRKTAEQMAKEQREISISEFFEKNKHLLGFDNPTKALLMVIKEAVDNSLDAVSQQKRINERSNEIIDELTTSSERADKQLILKASSEIRGQLGLQLEILRSLHDFEAVAQFQSEVLQAIGEVTPDVRNRIIQRLKERRTIRQSLSIA